MLIYCLHFHALEWLVVEKVSICYDACARMKKIYWFYKKYLANLNQNLTPNYVWNHLCIGEVAAIS